MAWFRYKVINEIKIKNLAFFYTINSFKLALYLFFNWDSLHGRLNNHYKAWSYNKKKHKKIKAYRKSL